MADKVHFSDAISYKELKNYVLSHRFIKKHSETGGVVIYSISIPMII